MDLTSMLKREDFFNLLFPTVENFFSSAYGEKVSFSFAEKNGAFNMVVKPRLSAISAIHPTRSACQFYYSEWNIRGSFMKYLGAKIYVFVMTHSGALFSQFRFQLQPIERMSPHFIIAPNNRSVRFFDYSKGTVGCIIKQGFSDKYFNNQIQFRLNHEYPFMVPMNRYGKNWLIEPILYGHPLARVRNKKAYARGVKEALCDISLLASDTIESISTQEYVSELVLHISEMLIEAEEKKHIRTIKMVHEIVEAAIKRTSHLTQIPTCMSHGDFQSGNIWLDKQGKIYIYDWETAGRRSVWYDCAVLNYSLRRSFGWRSFLCDEFSKKISVCDPFPNRTEEETFAIKGIVLLEDITFYLEDMMELPNDWGANVFDNFIFTLSESTRGLL